MFTKFNSKPFMKLQSRNSQKDSKSKLESLKNFQNDLKQNKRQDVIQYNSNLKNYEELYSEFMRLSDVKNDLTKKLDTKVKNFFK